MTSFFGSLRSPSQSASIENPQVPLSDTTLLNFLGIKETSSPAIAVEDVLGVPAAWRALMLSSNVPASVPFKAYRADDEGRNLMPANTQAQRLMTSPHPDMTAFELWQMVHFHRKAWGNAYLLKLGPLDRYGHVMQPTALLPIPPKYVRVFRDRETYQKLFAINPNNGVTEAEFVDEATVFTEAEILHLPGMGYDGISGVSPIRAARESFDITISAQSFGAQFYRSGSLATGVLQTDQRLTQTQADNLSARWRAKRTGLGNAFETIVLDKGAQFHQLTINPQDAQFLESRRFQVTEVCRWFGIPPFLMFETETSTSWGTGLEQQALAWVKFDLVPEFVALEQRISRILYPSPAYAKHSIEGLLRGDAASRSAFYTAMWSIGVLSTNEIRSFEEMGPVDGGDIRFRPLNMGELHRAIGPVTEAGPAALDPTKSHLALEAW
jgi:HK97 family phage portal protein